MLKLATGLGILSYAILLLGLLNILYPIYILIIFLVWIGFILFLIRKELWSFNFIKLKKIIESKNSKALLVIVFVLIIVNLVATFGPETAFDALWYHLTIPKIFLLHHSIYFIHGNLFYYSLMPKFTEMLYIIPLSLWNETGAKLLEFIFGTFTLFVIYRICRFYLSRTFSILAVLAFYSNLVVSWLSTSSYIDITRTFYEAFAFLYFLIFLKSNKNIYFFLSAVLLGFAICTKYFSLESIAIFCFLIFFIPNKTYLQKIKKAFLFALVSLLVPLPWFIISFYYTKNPFYPLFTVIGSSQYNLSLLSPVNFVKYFIDIFLFAPDPVSPIYLIVLPLILVNIKELFSKYRFLTLYSFGAVVIWYITPHDGGSRFLVPYLPILSVLVLLTINLIKNNFHRKILILTIIFISLSSIFYRSLANLKYIPVELGIETKSDFLMKNLNFSFGDFYDENSDIHKIVKGKKVLLVSLHNLYYIDFPFTLSEWQDANLAKYVLVQGKVPNDIYSGRKAIYKNDTTHVTLYKL